MTFFLQFRDATSDTPIIEFRFPFPFPVPQPGERVTLCERQDGGPVGASGRVVRIEWAYEITRAVPDVEPEPGVPQPPRPIADLDVFARLYVESDEPT